MHVYLDYVAVVYSPRDDLGAGDVADDAALAPSVGSHPVWFVCFLDKLADLVEAFGADVKRECCRLFQVGTRQDGLPYGHLPEVDGVIGKIVLFGASATVAPYSIICW